MPTLKPTRTRNPKTTALLAGGLVLGLGALAAMPSPWAGQAQADARFGTGQFNVEVRTGQGAAWQEARDGVKAARLNFAIAIADLQPGSTAYAPISLRTDRQSSSGTVTLEPAINRGNGTLFQALEYGVIQLPDAETECGPGADGTTVVAPGSPLDAEDTGSIELGPYGEDAAHLCFSVTLPPQPEGVDDAGSLADLQTTVQWQFTASADESEAAAGA